MMSIFNNFFWDFYWRCGNVRALWECSFFMKQTYNEKVMLLEAVLCARQAVWAIFKTPPKILKFCILVANITFFEIFQKKLSIVQIFHSKRRQSFRAPFKKTFLLPHLWAQNFEILLFFLFFFFNWRQENDLYVHYLD